MALTMACQCLSRLTIDDLDLSADDLQEAYHCYEELRNQIQHLFDKRVLTIVKLSEIIEGLHETHHNVNISKVVGSSVGILGGGLSILGVVLTPVSFGTSLGLTIVGSGIAATGGLVSTGAGITEAIISKSKMNEAQAAISADSSQVEAVKKQFELFERISDKIMKAIEKCRKSDNSFIGRLKRAWDDFKQCKLYSAGLFLWYLFTLGKKGFRAIAAGWDLFQLLLYGAERFVTECWIATHITRLVATNTFKTLDMAFLAIGLVLDIITLISTIVDMTNGSKSEVALKLQEHVEALKAEQRFWDELFLHAKKTN